MTDREMNELTEDLAKVGLSVIAPCLYEPELRDCFEEFYTRFRRVIVEHLTRQERNRKRLGMPGQSDVL